jgi:hypothetical protein
MCGRFLGGGKNSRACFLDVENCRLDLLSSGLRLAQVILRLVAVVRDEKRLFDATLETLLAKVGVKTAFVGAISVIGAWLVSRNRV